MKTPVAGAAGAIGQRLILQLAANDHELTNPRVGGPVQTESDPLGPHPARWQRETIEAIRFVESVVPPGQLEAASRSTGRIRQHAGPQIGELCTA